MLIQLLLLELELELELEPGKLVPLLLVGRGESRGGSSYDVVKGGEGGGGGLFAEGNLRAWIGMVEQGWGWEEDGGVEARMEFAE